MDFLKFVNSKVAQGLRLEFMMYGIFLSANFSQLCSVFPAVSLFAGNFIPSKPDMPVSFCSEQTTKKKKRTFF
jgi:hypothetical protein